MKAKGALVKKLIIPAVVVIVIGILFLLPNFYKVERSITIDHAQEDVYAYLVNLETSKEWSPWAEIEPTAEFTTQGTPGVVGSSLEWQGKEIGSGKQILTVLEEPNYIEYKMEFNEPVKSEATAYFRLTEGNPGVNVVWGIKASDLRPIQRVMALFVDSMMGSQFEKGLANLKGRLEKSEASTY